MADNIVINVTARDQGASSLFDSLGGKIVVANQALGLFQSALNTVSAPFSAIVSEGREFEQQLANIQSVSKLTSDEFKTLADEAKRIGSETTFTATNAGKAMEELARAGFDATKILDTTTQVMDLAAATGSDLATSAGVVAVQLGIFEKQGLTAIKAVDLMVKTVGASPQNFEQLSGALETSSGTAAAFNIKFEDLTQILGAMANAGVRGEKAGTALNGALSRLANPTNSIVDALGKYNINIEDVNPATNKFADIIDILNKKQVEAKDLLTILGQEAGPKFIDVIKSGKEGLEKFAEKQRDANSASEAASERMDTLEGDIAGLTSAISGVSLQIFEDIKPVLRDIVQFLTDAVRGFGSFIQSIKDSGSIFDGFVDTANTVKTSIGKIAEAFGFSNFISKTEDAQEAIKDVDQSAQDLEMTLTGNTLSESINTVRDIMSDSVGDADDMRTGIEKLNDKAGDLDKTFKEMETPSFFAGAGDVAAQSAQQIGGQILGVGGAIQGAQAGGPVGAVVGAATEILMANEGFREQIGKLNDSIARLADPIVDSLIPFFEEIVPLLNDLKPLFVVIGDFLSVFIETLAPVFDSLEDVFRNFGEIMKDLGPPLKILAEVIGKVIGAILVPTLEAFSLVLEALEPVFEKLEPLLITLEPILDILVKLLQVFMDIGFVPTIKALVLVIDVFFDAIVLFEKIVGWLSDVFYSLWTGIENAAGALFDAISAPINNFISALDMIFRPIVNFLQRIFIDSFRGTVDFFQRVITGPMNNVVDFFQRVIIGPMNNVFDFFQRIIIGPMNNSVDFFQRVIIGPLNNVFNFFKDLINDLLGGLSGIGGGSKNNFGLPKLFHDGGLISNSDLTPFPGARAGEGLIIAQAGERVLSRNEVANGVSGGINLTFNIKSISPREQSEEIRQMLEEMVVSGRLNVA